MKWKKITKTFMLAVTIIIVGYDAYVAFFNSEKGDTISKMMLEFATWTLLIPVAWGILLGHWFWPQYIDKDEK